MTAFIENYFAITTYLLKKDLRKSRLKEPVDGYLNIKYDNRPSVIDYSVEYYDDKTYLVIVFGPESQRILLQEHQLTFGVRTYLTCACKHRTNTLYLKNGVFACQRCQKLHYSSTLVNRTSLHGKFIYQQNQILRLMTMRESMGRIFYKSRYSKKFVRWLDLCARIGLVDEIKDANDLMTAIHS